MNRAAPLHGLVLLLACSAPLSAAPVYKWVDEHGNVTYSEEPPPENAVDAEQVEIQSGPSAEAIEAGRQREADLRNKADRMEADRNERESARQEAQPEPPETQVIDAGGGSDYYGYPRYPHRREAIREKLKDRPVQLPERPVARPVPRPAPLPQR